MPDATLLQVRKWFSEGTICGNDRQVSMTEMKELSKEDSAELKAAVGAANSEA